MADFNLKGKLYRALYDFQTDDENDLQFKAGDIIIVQDMGNGTDEEWWLGELNGLSGCFPGSYVKSVDGIAKTKSFTAPEDEVTTRTNSKSGKRVSWGENQIGEALSRHEYDRPDRTVDVEASHNVWITEEDEEKERQMRVFWETRERDLPPGQKCPERLAFEGKAEREAAEREEKRAKFKAKRAAKRAATEAGVEWDDDAWEAERAATALAAVAARTPAPPPPVAAPEPDPDPAPERRGLPMEPEPESSDEEMEIEPVAKLRAVEEAIDGLEASFETLMREDDRGATGFHEDYNDLSMEDSHRFSADKCTAAVNNPTLNRYRDILPYDVARVMLNTDVPDNSSYINASSIVDLLPGSPQYFTAQGPKPETVGHFWKMVAQYRSGVVVMVTRCNESGRVKCEQYWPTEEEGSRHFAEDESGPAVSVVATGEIPHETWTERRFTILQKSGSFDVVQLHFEDWPDHGVPASPETLVDFIQAGMKAQRDYLKFSGRDSAPITVHCSAGVGRTGVWCTLYSIMTYLPYIKPGDSINIKGVVQRLRLCRRYMVQTIQQYVFCYTAAIYAGRQYLEAARNGSDAPIDPGSAARAELAAVTSAQLAQSMAREQVLLNQMFEMKEQMARLAAMVPEPEMGNPEMKNHYERAIQKNAQLEDQLETHIIMMHSKDLQLMQANEQLKRANQHIFDVEEQLDDANERVAQLESTMSNAAPPSLPPTADYLSIPNDSDEDGEYMTVGDDATVTDDVAPVPQVTLRLDDGKSADSAPAAQFAGDAPQISLGVADDESESESEL